MNILILNENFGMGHTRCAEAIRETVLNENPEHNVDIVNLIHYFLPPLSKICYLCFRLGMTKFSKLYNYTMEASDKQSYIPFKKIIAGRMHSLIKKSDPDLVIATFPMCAEYFSLYKEIYNCSIPLFIYVTDITSHNEWLTDYANLYFVPDTTTKESLVSKGVDPDNVCISGIPVSDRFSPDNNDSLKSDSSKTRVLVTGGGMGFVPGQNKILSSLNSLKNVETTLVCGNNKKLESAARKKYKNIKVIGFTNHMPEYMFTSDVIISKPGGITTFEAIKTQTPIIVTDSDVYQEKENAKYISEHHIGIIIDGKKATADILEKYICDKPLLEEMRNNMASISAGLADSNPLHYLNRKTADTK